MRWQLRLMALRTALTGVDPGLMRLRLAAIATAAMALASGIMSVLRALTGTSVTVVIFAAVLAMISNLAVNEPDLSRRRVTTLAMALPAAASVGAGTLLAPYRVIADVVFVAVIMVAVYVRRFGPRGFALGMAGFMPYFFTQFLHATISELGWLLVAAAIGIGSTLLLACWLLAERPERTVARLVQALQAHVYALIEAVANVLAVAGGQPGVVERELDNVRRRRTRLNETALQATERVEQGDDLALWILDVELAAELDSARQSVAALVAQTQGYGDRTQRVGFAVVRLADALQSRTGTGTPSLGADTDSPSEDDDRTVTEEADEPTGLALTTRQAIQVGVATSLAIIIGELISPSRWYWAVVAAFVIFAGTTSRGDMLSRGMQRVIGTVGGVIAGMGLAVVVGPHHLVSLVLIFGCVFMALYLFRVSQALMAFWITAVLALLYGLIGQFSVQTLVLRAEETAVGAALGMLAGYLVLPKGTREAFDEALDDLFDAVDAVLATSINRILGRPSATGPVELARSMDTALDTLRARMKPLDNPLPRRRGRTSYERAVAVLTGVDHYARGLARVSGAVRDPGWAATLQPAAYQVRANLGALRQLLLQRTPGRVESAEGAARLRHGLAGYPDDRRRRTWR
ncbi:MAG: FUSC family protein [Actinobacteria bacterium]|nr:FUSC family protein [Actinomycetota bacterium]